MDYILRETNFKKSRIGFETPVKVSQADNSLRADLLLYTHEFKPEVLIECKSEKVKLNESVALQAARYNSSLNADYIVLTNGVEDFMFHQKNGINSVEELPCTENSEQLPLDVNYWSDRGFCPASLPGGLESWLPKALTAFWGEKESLSKRYLSFTDSLIPLPMENYYRLFKMAGDQTLSITFIGYKTSDAYLIGVLSKNRKNEGVVVINLQHMLLNKVDSAHCYRQGACEISNANKKLPFSPDQFKAGLIKKLPVYLMKFFE